MEKGRIDLNLKSATGLRNAALLRSQDPYAHFTYQDQVIRTETHLAGGTEPVWGFVAKLEVDEASPTHVDVNIYNHNTFFDDLLGSCKIPLDEACAKIKAADGGPLTETYIVQHSERARGSLEVDIAFVAPGAATPEPAPVGDPAPVASALPEDASAARAPPPPVEASLPPVEALLQPPVERVPLSVDTPLHPPVEPESPPVEAGGEAPPVAAPPGAALGASGQEAAPADASEPGEVAPDDIAISLSVPDSATGEVVLSVSVPPSAEQPRPAAATDGPEHLSLQQLPAEGLGEAAATPEGAEAVEAPSEGTGCSIPSLLALATAAAGPAQAGAAGSLALAEPAPVEPAAGVSDAGPGSMAVAPAAAAAVFESIDVNGNGELSRAEVIKACRGDPRVRGLLGLGAAVRQEDGTRDAFEQVFQALDADSSKAITRAEFVRALAGTRGASDAAVPDAVGGVTPLPDAPMAAALALPSSELNDWRVGLSLSVSESAQHVGVALCVTGEERAPSEALTVVVPGSPGPRVSLSLSVPEPSSPALEVALVPQTETRVSLSLSTSEASQGVAVALVPEPEHRVSLSLSLAEAPPVGVALAVGSHAASEGPSQATAAPMFAAPTTPPPAYNPPTTAPPAYPAAAPPPAYSSPTAPPFDRLHAPPPGSYPAQRSSGAYPPQVPALSGYPPQQSAYPAQALGGYSGQSAYPGGMPSPGQTPAYPSPPPAYPPGGPSGYPPPQAPPGYPPAQSAYPAYPAGPPGGYGAPPLYGAAPAGGMGYPPGGYAQPQGYPQQGAYPPQTAYPQGPQAGYYM